LIFFQKRPIFFDKASPHRYFFEGSVSALSILKPAKWRLLLMQEYEDLKVLVAEIEADINKAEGGNKAAGTRVRKQMQKIKQAAQLVRNRILEIRSAE
jgi:hypothetical protein